MAMSNKKRATFIFILLMTLFLVVELFNIISETKSGDLDKFEFVGSVYNLQTKSPRKLAEFYRDYLNFYSLPENDTNIIALGNDAVRLNLLKSLHPEKQTMVFRTEKISRLFRKLIGMKRNFKEPMHLDHNEKLTFTIFDTDSNKITFIGN